MSYSNLLPVLFVCGERKMASNSVLIKELVFGRRDPTKEPLLLYR